MVKAAFWDTEQGAQVPSFLGAVQGTPTIRFFKPDSKSKSNKKVPIDYNGERKAKALISFAKQHEPNHIVSVKSLAAFDDFVQKADRNGLPKAVVFSKSASTSSMLKAMTVEYRRRLLIAEVKVSGATKVLEQRFGVSTVPALLVLGGADGTSVVATFEQGKKITLNRLMFFFDKHALKRPIQPQKQNSSQKAEL